jgi:acyl-CoA thioester hydrolase
MQRPASQFPRTSSDKVRYADTDRQGHVNNAVFATFLETARVEIFYDPARPLADHGAEFVIAALHLTFLGEIRWPGAVTIGTGVQKIGTSSVTLAQAIFQNGRCVAQAEVIAVHIDTATRKARPLSEATRSALDALRFTEG